ncbi:MAG TPA: RimK domain-containing protein ATP-grasp [Thermoanaerobaculia bacterium]|jgi:glutathione synthase/RimK-type ligase-like ATP-grasp enzyme|nr:RimK domain-containing protein ATP-grasp [Thermoanaerobaculia bacterium]
MILLWGDPTERPMASVLLELRRLGAPVVVLSDEEMERADLGLGRGGVLDGELRLGGPPVELARITAAYLRPAESIVGTPAAARVVEGLLTWANTSPARVVNRPSSSAANNSKPYQSALIRDAGFRTPETLLSTDPAAIREFWRRHGEVIYKSISGIRSIVSRLGPEQEAYLEDVTHCPTMFQRYVEGCDHRVHVVGEEIHACRVESPADDYRYPKAAEQRPRLEDVRLDPELSSRLLAMVRAMDLLVAGVDLRLAPDGSWYCFEVNPSPAFSYFSQATGQPIARSIARLLAA